METELTIKDLDLILESLIYSKKKFEENELYPSKEFKLQRIQEVEDTINKIRELKSQRRT